MRLIREPKVTCAAVIERKGKILFIKRKIRPYKNSWCLPGGHVEWKEKAEDTVKREIKEELGLDFKPRFLKYYDEILPKLKYHRICLVFTGNAAGEPRADEKEAREFKWFSLKEIRKLNLVSLYRRAFEDYYKLNKFN